MDVMLGDPCIYVWDLHIEAEQQRKGVGKHLLTLLSLIGTREKMLHLCVPVQMFDDHTKQWLEGVRGFAPDTTLKKLIKFDSEMEVRRHLCHGMIYTIHFFLLRRIYDLCCVVC